MDEMTARNWSFHFSQVNHIQSASLLEKMEFHFIHRKLRKREAYLLKNTDLILRRSLYIAHYARCITSKQKRLCTTPSPHEERAPAPFHSIEVLWDEIPSKNRSFHFSQINGIYLVSLFWRKENSILLVGTKVWFYWRKGNCHGGSHLPQCR